MTIHKFTPSPDAPGDREPAFAEFYKWYPHNPGRRDKAKTRAMFMKITAPGGTVTKSKNRDSGGFDEIGLEATPEQLVQAVKNYRKSLIPQATGSYSPETTYVPFASVWLNQGRFEDYL